MRRIAQSTSYVVMLKAFLDTDHVTAATGKTIAVTISKAGGAFGNPNAGATNATEVSSGWYKVTLDTTDTNTLGDLVVRGTNADCDDIEQICQVVSATTGGATNLDSAVSTRASQTSVDDLPTNAELATAIAGADDATLSAIAALNNLSAAQVNAEVDTALADVGLTTTVTGRIDAAITTRMASYTQPTGFLAATFPSDPADQSLVIAATDALATLIGDVPTNSELATALGTADDAVLTQVALVKAKTDLIPAAPAAVSDIPTANQNADALLDRADAIETGLTLRGATRLIAASSAGKAAVSGATVTFRNVGDTKNRITATTDDNGQRTAVTTDAT